MIFFITLLLKVVNYLMTYAFIIYSVTLSIRLVKIHVGRYFKFPVSQHDAIIITGGTSGIGLLVAKHLFNIGYTVFVGYYNAKEVGYSELEKIVSKTKDNRLILIELDVTSEESIKKFRKRVESSLKTNKRDLYALINNAGVASLQPPMWVSFKTAKQVVNTNLLGTYNMTRYFVPLLAGRRGRIINVSSALAFVPGKNYELYGATKRALVYLSNCFDKSFEQFNIKNITILPHNYIKETNIELDRPEEGFRELSEDDKKFYEPHYKKHLAEANKRLNSREGSVKNAARPNNMKEHIIDFLVKFYKSATGQNIGFTMKNSGIINCYEDALRLPYPPQEIFDTDYGMGAFSISMPLQVSNFYGYFVQNNLFR